MSSRGEKKSFLNLTGNPFVDEGIYVIETYYGKDSTEK